MTPRTTAHKALPLAAPLSSHGLSTPRHLAPAGTRQQILDTARPIIAGKGFAAVGLSEILAAAGVPKGSFYHWFRSKEQFGEALLEGHFAVYLHEVDITLADPARPARERLLAFFERWHALQSGGDLRSRCLVVKLSAEVSDLSEPMRAALERGMAQVLARLADCLADGRAQGEFDVATDPEDAAQDLYQQWLGATLMSRVQRRAEPLDRALARLRQRLSAEQNPA